MVADCKTTGVRIAQFKLPYEPPHRVEISSDEYAATAASARPARRYVITARDSHFGWRRIWDEFERHAAEYASPRNRRESDGPLSLWCEVVGRAAV